MNRPASTEVVTWAEFRKNIIGTGYNQLESFVISYQFIPVEWFIAAQNPNNQLAKISASAHIQEWEWSVHHLLLSHYEHSPHYKDKTPGRETLDNSVMGSVDLVLIRIGRRRHF